MKARAFCLPVICLPNIPVTSDFSESHVNSTQHSDRSTSGCPNVLVWLVMCSNSSAGGVCSIHPLRRVCQSKAKTLSELEANCCTQTKVDERDFSDQPHWKLPNLKDVCSTSCWFVIDLQCMFRITTIDCYALTWHQCEVSFVKINKMNVCHL